MCWKVTLQSAHLLDHSWPLQAQTPPIDSQIFRQSHRLQHLRPEHPTIPNFNPLFQPFMVAEDLQTRLGVRIIRRLKLEIFDPHLSEEDLHESNQSAECEPKVSNHAFDLVELGEMGMVNGLVAEDAVDGEVTSGSRVQSELMKHIG